MGGLTSAIENVEFERHASEDMVATSAAMQGFRADMEDHHTICLRLPNHQNHAFIGLYDGHSGSAASHCLAQQYWRKIDSLPEITKTKLKDIIREMDEDWSKDPRKSEGSTVLFAVIERPKYNSKSYNVTMGWAGDSRGIAVKAGKLENITKDHKPSNPDEKARIEHANGWVTNDRVDGELAVSRSFGDWNMKDYNNGTLKYHELKVTCVLEFNEIELEEGDYLLLSCDGLTEQLENEDIFNKLMELKKEHPDNADVVLDGLMQRALSSGSKDNMSTILVEFRAGESFYKRDRGRLRTCRPGPLVNNLTKNRFFEAYKKNIEAMGLKDCKELRLAAYIRDEKRAGEEYRGTRPKERPGFQDTILQALQGKASLRTDDAKEDEEANNIDKYQKKLETIKLARDNLESMNFACLEEPKKAYHSAFKEEFELLLTPDHEYYMAFMPENLITESDEKNELSLDENLPGIASDCNQLGFSSGESVRVKGDQSIMQKECEKQEIVLNDMKLRCLGKQGRVVAVDGNGANVRFEDIGEIFLPLAVLRPLVFLTPDVKLTLEQVCKQIKEDPEVNQGPRMSLSWNLTLNHVRELVGIIYPKKTSREVEELAGRWKEKYDITQAGLYLAFNEIQSKDKGELVNITERLKEFLKTQHCKVQMGDEAEDVVHVPLEKTTLLDIAQRVSERMECDISNVFLRYRGKRYTSESPDLKEELSKLVELLPNKKTKVFAGKIKKQGIDEDLKLDDRD